MHVPEDLIDVLATRSVATSKSIIFRVHTINNLLSNFPNNREPGNRTFRIQRSTIHEEPIFQEVNKIGDAQQLRIQIDRNGELSRQSSITKRSLLPSRGIFCIRRRTIVKAHIRRAVNNSVGQPERTRSFWQLVFESSTCGNNHKSDKICNRVTDSVIRPERCGAIGYT